MAVANLIANPTAPPAIDSGQNELPVVTRQRKRKQDRPGLSRHFGPALPTAERLRARIRALGLSHAKAAAHLGLTRDGLAKQLSGARPVSRQTTLLLGHLESDRLGLPKREHEILPPVDWPLWEKLMRSEMAHLTAPVHATSDAAERLYDHNRHWLNEYRKADYYRAMLLERYLVKRINACRNHDRAPHQKSRGQLRVPGG
jgi:hypothetical protein